MADQTSIIRRAAASDAQALSSLALASKGVWGYDAAFLEMCREELTLSPAFIEQNEVYLIDSGSDIMGFYALIAAPPTGVLDFLYVHPDRLHHGFGRRLWDHAAATARSLGIRSITIDADPNAEAFYAAMGAKRIGEVASGSIPGRTIPLMRVDL